VDQAVFSALVFISQLDHQSSVVCSFFFVHSVIVPRCEGNCDDLLNQESQNGVQDDAHCNVDFVRIVAGIREHIKEFVHEEVVVEHDERSVHKENQNYRHCEPGICPEWLSEGISD